MVMMAAVAIISPSRNFTNNLVSPNSCVIFLTCLSSDKVWDWWRLTASSVWFQKKKNYQNKLKWGVSMREHDDVRMFFVSTCRLKL